MNKALLSRLERIAVATAAKFSEKSVIKQEYEGELEQVGPAPGQPWDQHDTMVSLGLCKAAVAAPEDNRYCNLFPFDENRVVLTGMKRDYINASWVRMEGLENKLILTMAPLHPDSQEGYTLANTCPQFWRMVDQEDVKLVVMLCKVQPGFTGCSQYFPDREFGPKLKHGDLEVETVSAVSQSEGVIVRDIRLRGLSGEVKEVKHIQFTNWPNYGVVEDLAELAEFMKAVSSEWEEVGGPLVVHCSGGVGRSGTFTTILTLYNLLLTATRSGDLSGVEKYLGQREELRLTGPVLELRRVRHPWMVEGENQYLLAYQAVLEILNTVIREQKSQLSDS